MNANRELSHIGPRNVRPLRAMDAAAREDLARNYEDLKRLGIGFHGRSLDQMIHALAMDNLEGTVTSPSIATPIQFLQTWLPGFVEIMTAARKIDDLVGITTAGDWQNEEVVQGVLERTGTATPYGDLTNVPLSSWNTNFERRTIVRFEEGMRVGRLEEARAAAIRVNSAAEKRSSAALALEIERNNVGFNGFNDGDGRTYGILNDPGLPSYVPVAASGTGGTTEWVNKTFLQIQADLLEALQTLRTQSKDVIDPGKTPITLAIATASRDYLSTTSDFGISVMAWLKEAYPNVRVESAPQFDAATGGDNVFYMYAETVADSGTDDGRTFMQVVPAKFMVLGVAQQAKGYEEDYTNATAGVICKRPYAVVRRSGI